MLDLGAGRGWIMSLGVLRLSTMAAGIILAVAGVGAQGRSTTIQSMGRRSLGSWAVADLDSEWVLEWDGFHSVLARSIARGTAAAADTCAMSTCTTHIS